MSWNAHRFCGGLESMLNAAFSAAGNARRQTPVDTSGPRAIARLAAALRRERAATAGLQRELLAAYARLEVAEAELRARPRRR